jgi:hypothetical protein
VYLNMQKTIEKVLGKDLVEMGKNNIYEKWVLNKDEGISLHPSFLERWIRCLIILLLLILDLTEPLGQ